MNEHDNDDALLRALRERFEAGLESVSELDRARLRRARRQALSQADQAPAPRRSQWVAPVALAASMALVAVLLFPGGSMPWFADPAPLEDDPAQLADAAAVSDLEILLSDDALSLYEDLDFYVWVEARLADEESRDAG